MNGCSNNGGKSKVGKKIFLGLIGFGTIGTGVVRLLGENRDLIKRRLGAELVIKKIADLDIETPRVVTVDKNILTRDVNEILEDPEISIVMELMGGYEPAMSFLIKAMRNKKHVVTANKALLASYGHDIFSVADEEMVNVGFEASVGGTIPIIKTLKESLVANNIESIFGIMNGTSNYILTRMTDENKAFDIVLKEAQDLGFAEADPTFDVEGIDVAHKLVITLTLSYGKRVAMDDIHREGISEIREQDIEFAGELGYKIKLLAIAMRKEDSIEARIHPTMIPFDHILASVNGNYNAVHFVGDASGSVFLYGQGAGMMPTASAVVSDLVDIGRDAMKGTWRRVPLRSFQKEYIEDINLMPMDDIVTNYYLRFSAVDRPGVLSKISGILGNNNISIASVIQKERKLDGAVPVVMTTHRAMEKNVRIALEEIDTLDIVRGKTALIRIEDSRLK
ncbi:MAG: homoserine dehydrogenase [Deltaproteobacteria bacterium]|jgi:homoserine dehydrogenase|nr:homoserine dehydrogenase [Deltaproteobacteria bacterium]